MGQAWPTCLKPWTTNIKIIANFTRLFCRSGTKFPCPESMCIANLMMKMCQVIIREWEGYTQHKPEVVEYCEPFRDFCTRSWKCMLQRESILRNYIYCGLIVKVLLTLGLHAVFVVFCKMYGYFCKVFAAYKQVRDSMAFLYQIAGILLLLFTTIHLWYLSKVFVYTVPKIKWNMLNFMSLV